MTTATRPTPADRPALRPAPGGCVTLREVGWDGYSTLLRLRGSRSRPKMLYLDGSVLLMSPLYRHEWIADRLGLFVHLVTTLLRIPCTSSASTTFRRQALDKGVEGDQSFYLANEMAIRGRSELNLEIDPPPDLAIEVEITHPADDALRVYAALGVPEVWRCDGTKVRIFVIQGDGTYHEQPISQALPFLRATEVGDIVLQPNDDSQTQWTLELMDWIRETLEPRCRRENAGSPQPLKD